MSTPIDRLLISVEIEEGTKAADLLEKLKVITDERGNVEIDFPAVEDILDQIDELKDKIAHSNQLVGRNVQQVRAYAQQIRNLVEQLVKDLETVEESTIEEIKEFITDAEERIKDFVSDVTYYHSQFSDIIRRIDECCVKEDVRQIVELLEIFRTEIIKAFAENLQTEIEKIDFRGNIEAIKSMLTENKLEIRGNREILRDGFENLQNWLESEVPKPEDIITISKRFDGFLDDMKDTVATYKRSGWKTQLGLKIGEELDEFKQKLDDNIKGIIRPQIQKVLEREKIMEKEFFETKVSEVEKLTKEEIGDQAYAMIENFRNAFEKGTEEAIEKLQDKTTRFFGNITSIKGKETAIKAFEIEGKPWERSFALGKKLQEKFEEMQRMRESPFEKKVTIKEELLENNEFLNTEFDRVLNGLNQVERSILNEIKDVKGMISAKEIKEPAKENKMNLEKDYMKEE